MSTTIAIQADPLKSLDLKNDTTLRISREGQKRGAPLFAYTPDGLTYTTTASHLPSPSLCHPRESGGPEIQLDSRLRGNDIEGVEAKGGSLLARGSFFHFDNQGHLVEDESETLNLAAANFVLIRQNPPFDKKYLTNTLLLDHLPVRAINDPKGLRIVSEKLFTLGFPDLIPPTLVTVDYQQAIDFIHTYQQVILKPLYEYGGKGILILHDQDPNKQPLLELYTNVYPEGFLLQKYLPEVKQGDKRILLINGHPVGAYLRQPPDHQIRSNLRVGGTALPCELTARDYEICEAVAPFLKQWGLYLVGLDVIGTYLTEVNVTSPTGFATLEQLYDVNAAALFWEGLGV